MMVANSSEGRISTNIIVPKTDLERLDAVAIERRMSRAALIRESILKTIAEHEKNKEY